MTRFQAYIQALLQERVLLHVLAWLGFIVGWLIYASLWGNNLYELIINKLCYLPPQIIATYLLLYYQLPQQIYQGKYVAFSLLLVANMYFNTVLARWIKVYVYEPIMHQSLDQDSIWSILTHIYPLIGQYLLWVAIPPALAIILKLLKTHFSEMGRFEQLQKEKAKAELNFLQAQLHPHFLFNTLNNLYTLSLQKSEMTPTLVWKLSEIVDYMFEECKADQVPIHKEIQLLQNYIDLELLRYGDRLALSFEHEVDEPTTSIAPLVLLSMVENAFKHGASGDMGKPTINIDLRVKKGHLYFRVFNSKVEKIQVDETAYKKGIGVANIKRQLGLRYPESYQFHINEEATTYEVILEIHLQTQPMELIN
ncbi:MAG: histidine kinase [Saprospiraceae bacterium]|nr:histidine kinase [Saprospiraceae bacterium]